MGCRRSQCDIPQKEGKDSYAAPGAYIPISLTSYIGKILNKILADRLNLYLLKIGLVDLSQEGFCKGRNTVRNLNKLTLSINDFEKAFDSTWKKGIITKLWHDVGVRGLYLRLIDSFLFSRTVSLLFNGHTGFARLCLEYGLPQRSALSLVIFRFYIHDLGESFVIKQCTDFYKFADDGTAKVSGVTLQYSLSTMQSVLDEIHKWTKKWRMVINCQKNKTEIICFNSPEGKPPQSFKLGEDEIHTVTSSKVLGVILDNEMK